MKGCDETLMSFTSYLPPLILCPDTGWTQGERTLGLMPKHLAFSKRSLISILRWSGLLVTSAAFSSQPGTDSLVQHFSTETCLYIKMNNICVTNIHLYHLNYLYITYVNYRHSLIRTRGMALSSQRTPIAAFGQESCQAIPCCWHRHCRLRRTTPGVKLWMPEQQFLFFLLQKGLDSFQMVVFHPQEPHFLL